MEPYLNLSGDSGVTHFESGPDYIRVRFRSGTTYRYGPVRPGRHHVAQMKAFAAAGRGLATYINEHVRNVFEDKE